MIKKKEYIEQCDALQKEVARLNSELWAERERIWNRKIPNATYEAHRKLKEIYGRLVYNLTFEHVDAAGYWFSFELINDSRKQTVRINHEEVKEQC